MYGAGYGAGYPAAGYGAYPAPGAYGVPPPMPGAYPPMAGGYVAPGMMPAGCMAYQPGMVVPPGYKLSKKGYLKPISHNPYKVHKKMYKH